jgi:uncharacterized protein
MKRAFGDSFFFIALLNPRDAYHQRVAQLSRDWEGQIITTRWVLAEIGNALSGVNARPSFVTFLAELKQQAEIIVLADSDHLFDEGIRLFATRPDKEWSLTDCISFEAMRACGLEEALTGDHHFEQAGFKMLLNLPAQSSG